MVTSATGLSDALESVDQNIYLVNTYENDNFRMSKSLGLH